MLLAISSVRNCKVFLFCGLVIQKVCPIVFPGPVGPGGDEEICPYATFHLLGFREEMDPAKAAATLPHPPGHGHHRGANNSQPNVLFSLNLLFI